jgi:autotransporter-associated beta strand protein
MKKVRINDGGRSAFICTKSTVGKAAVGRFDRVDRPSQRRLLWLAAFAAAGVISNKSFAASGSWTGATDPNWADPNWSASPPPGIADTARFNSSGGLYTTIDLGSGVTVNNIIFDSANAAAYTIGNYSAGAQTLSLNTSGGITMNSTVANNELFNSGIVLGTNANAATYTIINNSLSNSLIFAGNISGGVTGGTAGTETLIVAGAGNTVIGGSLLNGGAGQTLALTKYGTGTLTFNGATNASVIGSGAGGGAFGTVTVNSGSLVLNYSNYNAVGNADLLNSTTPVTLGGGSLQIIGNATNASTQNFNNVAGVTVNSGLNTISVGPNAGSLSNPLPTLNLGAFTQNIGSETVFNGPAYYSGASTTGVTTPAASNAATGTITTTTLGNQNELLWPTSRAAIATVGLYNWASVVNTSAGTHSILSGDQVTGFYVQVAPGGTAAAADTNYDLLGNATASSTTTWYTDTLRFNVQGAFNFNTTSAGTGHITLVGGILVTPNVGANNTTIANGGSYLASADSTAGNCPIDVYQNNTAGELLINVPFYYYSSTSRATCFVQGGAGTVNLTGQGTSDGNYGATYLNGGTTIISDNSQLGRVATNATLNLNGGTALGALNGLSLGTRPVALGGNGGGLAALTGTQMNVSGFISGAVGTGPLVIGIPASAANGNNTAGLVPGTGTGTANAANYAAGTVVLNASAGNGYYGGTIILGGAKLNINSEYQVGGANQGPVTFNNGTLQYATTLLNGVTDITQNTGGVAQTVTFAAGGGTIDTNGHAIVFANPIGGNGTGGFTLTDSVAVAANRGSLTLNGANSYTGPTTVSAGTLILANGSSLASSGVTVNSGAYLLAKGNVSIAGGLTLSSGSSFSMVDNAIGTVTTGSLTTSANDLMSIEFTGATNDQMMTTQSGGLTINGGTFNLSTGSSSGALPLTTDGTYNLISYVGSDTISGGNNDTALNADLKIGNPVYGLTYDFHDTGSGSIQLLVTGVAATSSSWITDGSSSWATAANWSSSAIPNSVGSSASFAGAAATHSQLIRSITLDGNKTVGALFFDSPNGESYLINQGTGGSLNFNTGSSATAALTVNAGTHYIYAPVTLSSNVDITTTGTSTLTIGGNINNGTGTNTLTKDGTGTLALSGTNTYGPAAGTTGTIIDSGTVQIGSSSALSTGDVSITAPVNPVTLQATAGVTIANNINISSGVTFTLDTQANSVVLSGVSSGSGSGITKIGTGSLIINGSNTYTGATNVSAGTLQLGNGGTSGYLSGNIINSGTLILNRTDNYALGNVISGTGTLTQIGSDAVTLNGANSFSGNTVINSGSLITGNALALQDSTLNYNNQGGTLSFGTLTAAAIGGLTGSQNLALTNTASAPVSLSFNGSGTNLYTGNLSGGSASLTMSATGTQTIGSGTAGGANYTGGTTVNSGTLVLGGVTNISDGVIGLTGLYGASNLTIADSAQVNSSSILYLEDLPVYQGATQYFPASSTLVVKGNSQLTVPGLSFGLPTGTRVVSSTVTVQDNATLTVNGAFNLEQTAGGTASNNTVNLNGGTLAVQNFLYSGGGGGTGTTQVANLQFNGGVLKALASDPASSSFLPNFTGVPADVDAGGAIVNTNSFNDTIATPLLHNTGTATDGGLTKTGAGVLTLTANATYNGPTVISGGTLRLGVAGALVASYSFDNTTNTPVGSPSRIVNTGNGGSAMNGNVLDAYSGINIVAGGPKINGVSGNALQFTGDGSAVQIPSAIENLSGAGSWTVSTWMLTTQTGATILSKNTGGTWVTGNSMFYLTNGTSGSAGNLAGASAAGVIPSANRVNAGYETAALTANVADGNWHMVTYVDNAGTKSIYIDGVLSALSQNGIGNAADVGTQVQLGYSPDTTATDGAAQLNGNLDDINFFNTALTAAQIQNLMNTNSAFGSNPNAGTNTLLPTTTVSITTAGASLDVNGSAQTIASLTGVTGTTVTLGGGSLTVGNGTNTTFAGNITDSGGASALTGGNLVKQGTGTLTLSGSNTYTGGTNVSAGELVLASGTAFPSGNSQAGTGLIVAAGATLQIANHGSGATYVPIASSLTNAGTIDLTNNAMIIRNGSIGTISAEVAAAYNGGNWNGASGAGVITSSLAATSTTHLTAVGVAAGLTTTFEGVSVLPTDVELKYTWYGDANLDGKVDGSDYSRIDNGALLGLTGWSNGDFNYDGVINGSDYTLIDNAYNTQGAQLLSEVASPNAQIIGSGTSSAVPEPASLGLIGVGASMLLGRRRRGRSK